ncbi:MAG: phosphatase PAP2 family protein [Chloroflexota bacterium]
MSLEKFLAWDLRVSESMRVADQPGPLRKGAAFFAHSGDSWFWIPALIFVGWLGEAFWQARAIALGFGILVTIAVVMTLKFTIRRKRPEGEWGNMYRATDPHSFPSGHAARASLLAAMAVGLGPPWFAVTLVIWAPLVILARVAMGVHYLSDVLAGTLIGVIIGTGVYWFLV